MKRIFKNETFKILFSPITIGFLIIPIFLYAIICLSTSDWNIPYALSATIFIQMLIVAFFGYGVKIKTYQNETLKKKIINSSFKKYSYIIPFIILYVIILLISVLPVTVISMIFRDSLGYIEKYQANLIVDATNNFNQVNLAKGLDKNYLLFNSNWKTFGSFVYAMVFSMLLSFSTAHFMTIITKDYNRYLTISIIVFIFIFVISGILTKAIYILSDDGYYTKSENIIQNKAYILVRSLNPFYWMNQLLTSTIVADVNSGKYITNVNDPFLIDQGLSWYVQIYYYDIFKIGVEYPETIDFNYIYRPLLLDNIEIVQLLIVGYVPIGSCGLICFSFLKEVDVKW